MPSNDNSRGENMTFLVTSTIEDRAFNDIEWSKINDTTAFDVVAFLYSRMGGDVALMNLFSANKTPLDCLCSPSQIHPSASRHKI